MVVKHGIKEGMDAMETEPSGEKLGRRGTRIETGEDSKVINFIVCTVHLI